MPYRWRMPVSYNHIAETSDDCPEDRPPLRSRFTGVRLMKRMGRWMVLGLSRLFETKRSKALAEPLSTVTSGLASEPNQELHERTKRYIEALRRGNYDFVDLGTCDGGGFIIAERQGGRKGLGFDLEPSVVRRSLDKGLDVALYDVCSLTIDSACVDFAVCSHILEHLPSLPDIEKVLRSLKRLCRDYLLISGPNFEDEDYLEGLGIKILHSLMIDHTCRIKIRDLQVALQSIGCRDFVIALTEPINDSSNIWLYNAAQVVPPEGLWTFDAVKHLSKPTIKFDRRLHRDFVCVVPLRDGIACDEILTNFYWGCDKVVVRSSWEY